MITDVHTHVGEYPVHISEEFAAEARAAWPEVPWGRASTTTTRGALADVDRAVVLAFNAPAAGFVVPNDYVAAYVARDPARLIGFGSVDPSDPSAVDELERMKATSGSSAASSARSTRTSIRSAPSSCASARRWSGSSSRC